ncbi:hypothetical protein L1049_004740 [Liquidambar formosana]|uniref:Uncharacterized protein n=1 Tax=Liquidambar formosana TaxID=63359 RepID=A0AAP0RNP0_LIQFO
MLPDSSTDLEDVNAIRDIKQVYNITRNWQGDPCVPSNYSWDGLNCSYNINPSKIISLNLASTGLTGKIASSFSNLKSIESLDLSNNDLTGPVPEFFAQLPSLRILNFTRNKLSGSIPQAVRKKMEDGSLFLSAKENPNLCQSASCEGKKKFVIPVVASVLALILLSTLVMIFCYCKRKRQRVDLVAEFNIEGSLKSKNQEFTYSELMRITNNFKTVIGEGGFGKVYLGTLTNWQSSCHQVAFCIIEPRS